MAYHIFISYRRDDTLAMAVVLEKFLHNAFSDLHVFLDQEGIHAEQWPDKLRQAMEESALVLTLVGPKYLTIHNEHGERRIDEDDDWVRLEIETAVDQGKILVPLLVDGAKMLSKESFKRWPKLQKWLEWQAESIAWKTFNNDFEKLVGLIETKLNKKRRSAAANEAPGNPLDIYPLPDINPLEPDDEDLEHADGRAHKAKPYLGLRYFRRKDAPMFFGRTVEILKFFDLVTNPEVRIIRLLGNTGVGKSSFLAAGIRPRLERQHRSPYYARRNKVTGLDKQLAGMRKQHEGDAQPAVYILDQAEEMFTDPLPGEQERFQTELTSTLKGAPNATIVLGFRSDYLLEMSELLRQVLLRQEDPAEMNFNALENHKKPYSVEGQYRGQTTPARQFHPNALGLYDMSGNLWEWCWDWYGDYPTVQKPDYSGPESGSHRVSRGGSWDYSPQSCRVSNRGRYSPDGRNYRLGFRLARTP